MPAIKYLKPLMHVNNPEKLIIATPLDSVQLPSTSRMIAQKSTHN